MSGEILVLLKCSFLVGKWSNVWPGLPDCRASWSEPLPGIKRFLALWPLVWYRSVGLFGFCLFPDWATSSYYNNFAFVLKNVPILVHIYKLPVRRQAKLFYLTATFMEVSFGHFYLWFCLFPWLCIEISVRLSSILSCFWFTVFIFGTWSLCTSLSREAIFL